MQEIGKQHRSKASIGHPRMFVFTDCKFTDEHLRMFLSLTGLPITQSQLRFDAARKTCEWPIILDPTTFVGPILSMDQHIWHATNFLEDKAEVLQTLRRMNCAFWLRVYCSTIEQLVQIDLPIMERLVKLNVILQLIPGKAVEQTRARAYWKWFEDKRVQSPPE